MEEQSEPDEVSVLEWEAASKNECNTAPDYTPAKTTVDVTYLTTPQSPAKACKVCIRPAYVVFRRDFSMNLEEPDLLTFSANLSSTAYLTFESREPKCKLNPCL